MMHLPILRILSNSETLLPILFSGLLTSPFWLFIKQNGLKEDVVFLVCLCVMIALDTLTGVIKAWYRCNISSSRLKGIVVKFLLYMLAFLVALILTFFISMFESHLSFYLKGFLYSAMLIVEAQSLLENVEAISQMSRGKGIIPKIWLKRLGDFDQNGIYKGLKELQDEVNDLNHDRGKTN